MRHDCATEDRKLAIDRPCSACSEDPKMERHDHCPPFREPVASPQATRPIMEEMANYKPEPDFCVCDYRPRRKCTVHPDGGMPCYADEKTGQTIHRGGCGECDAAQPAAGTTPAPVGHIVGEGGKCWCGEQHADYSATTHNAATCKDQHCAHPTCREGTTPERQDESWRNLPIGWWFFKDSPECQDRYSVMERTNGGCTAVCHTGWHNEGAKKDMQSIAELHNRAVAPVETQEKCARCQLYHDRNHTSNAGGKWESCRHPAYLGTDHCEICQPNQRTHGTEKCPCLCHYEPCARSATKTHPDHCEGCGETVGPAVETRLTAEELAVQIVNKFTRLGLKGRTIDWEVIEDEIQTELEAFRDKSEAGLRDETCAHSMFHKGCYACAMRDREAFGKNAKGLREEIERLKRELYGTPDNAVWGKDKWIENAKYWNESWTKAIEQRNEAWETLTELRAKLAEQEGIDKLLTDNGVGFDPDNLKSLTGRIQMLLNWKNSTEYAEKYQAKRAEAAEAEAAALRERERWIPVKERIPEFEEPVWGLLPYESGKGYALAIVMRGDGEDGWLWHICKDWCASGMVDWPMTDMATADFECDDDYRVKFWLPLKALSAAPERPVRIDEEGGKHYGS